jgi:hypothetical protein
MDRRGAGEGKARPLDEGQHRALRSVERLLSRTVSGVARRIGLSLVIGFCVVLAGCGGTSSVSGSANASEPPITSSSPFTTTSPPEQATEQGGSGAPWCPAGAIALAGFKRPTAATGEQSVIAVLVNHSPASCSVEGVPRVVLKDAGGHTMPFRYENARGMYVPHTKPARISLSPGAHAYVKVGKYRCDFAGEKHAATIRLTASGVDVTSQLLPDSLPLAICGPDESTRPVGVSAIVASFDAAGG